MLPLLLNGPISHFADFECYITFLFLVLAAVGTCIGLFFLFKRLFARLYLVGVCIVGIVFWLLGLDHLFCISIVGLAVGIVAFLLANQNETRSLTANNMIGKSGRIFRKSKVKPESLFDREAMYRKIENAVTILSKAKIGALITFEKKDNLDELMRTGTRIGAPVSSELLQTIFYPGTRLHDGAVIIRNDQIAAASVYFVPTTKPLTGKFGSRHRAAIGISEMSDAVTVVVSEETGRISIAYQGELQSVEPDRFLEVFMDYMAMVKEAPER